MFFLNGLLTLDNSTTIIQQILQDCTNGDDLVIYINSGGGSIRGLRNIVDILKICNKPITTICAGYCASSSAILFLQGSTRLILPDSELIYHEPRYTFSKGDTITYSDILNLSKDSKNNLAFFISEMVKVSKFTKEELEDKILPGKELSLNAKQALRYGFATKICQDLNEITSII